MDTFNSDLSNQQITTKFNKNKFALRKLYEIYIIHLQHSML